MFDFDFFVHFFYQEGKGFFVNIFGEGVSEGDGFLEFKWGVDDIESHFSGFEVEGVFEFSVGYV